VTTIPLTEQQLDDIEQRATSEHLTPGPWTLDRESCDCSDGYCSHGAYVTGVVTPVPTEIAAERCKRTGEQPRDYDFHRSEIGDFTEADWALMVAAREDVPALLAEVRRLRATPSMVCINCETPVGWVDCPTGGWWAHETHPDDGHDADPMPAAIEAGE
jgi:hypothetical protein